MAFRVILLGGSQAQELPSTCDSRSAIQAPRDPTSACHAVSTITDTSQDEGALEKKFGLSMCSSVCHCTVQFSYPITALFIDRCRSVSIAHTPHRLADSQLGSLSFLRNAEGSQSVPAENEQETVIVMSCGFFCHSIHARETSHNLDSPPPLA
jgi:hypothetical protein